MSARATNEADLSAERAASLVEARWLRVVPSLTAPSVRLGYLNEQLRIVPTETAARALDAICRRAEDAEPLGRTLLHVVVELLADPEIDPIRDRLREVARKKAMLAAERLLRRPFVSPVRGAHHPPSIAEELHRSADDHDEVALAAHGRITPVRGVPDYGRGRPLTLGERKSLARRPTADMLPRLLGDPHPDVIRQVLASGQLTEDLVLRVATKRPGRADILIEIARHPRWCHRARVRLALVLNPATPPALSITMASLLRRQELRLVIENNAVHPALRASAMERLARMPPMRDDGDGTMQ